MHDNLVALGKQAIVALQVDPLLFFTKQWQAGKVLLLSTNFIKAAENKVMINYETEEMTVEMRD